MQNEPLLRALSLEVEASKAVNAALAARLPKQRIIPFIRAHKPKYNAGWFHRHLARKLEKFARQCAARQSPRLMVNVPPQYGKTELCSRSFPTWYLGNNPEDHVVVASYAAPLAEQLSAAARARAEASASWWPELARGKKWTDAEWELSRGGSMYGVGRGGSLSGKPAHVLVVDDLIKDMTEARSPATLRACQDFLESVAQARLQEGGGFLYIGTRWGQDDPAGYLLQLAAENPDLPQWEVVRYPAIAEADEYDTDGTLLRREGDPLSVERYSLQTMLQRKLSCTPATWSAVYQQRPIPAEGSVFLSAHLERPDRRWTTLPTLDEVVISCDLTFKDKRDSDYVVYEVWGFTGPNAYLIDIVRRRMNYPDSKQALRDLAAKHKPTAIIVEDKANGSAMVSELQKELTGVIGWDPGRQGKSERAEIHSVPRYAAGQVWLPASHPLVHDFVTEHLGFMAGAANDDMVDAESQVFAWHKSRRRTVRPSASAYAAIAG